MLGFVWLFEPSTFVLAEAPFVSFTRSLEVSIVFVAVILLGELLFRLFGVKKMELKSFGEFHNLLLCAWSLLMFVGLSLSVAAKVQKDGPFSLLCDAPASTAMTRGALSYWMWHYAVSKYYELVDTFLMVARRRPLTVLHLWHHSSIGPLSLSWLLGSWTLAWLGAWLNTGIHVAMYFYYFASSRYGYQPPWKRLITTAQIAQFFTVFFTITVFCFFYVGAGWNGVIWMTHTLSLFGTSVSFPLPYLSFPPQCAGDQLVVFGSQAINVSFLVLFINFYIQTYRSGKAAARAKKRE